MTRLESAQRLLPNGYRVCKWITRAGTTYQVSEISTGRLLVSGQKTPKRAVELCYQMDRFNIEKGAGQ